MHCVCQKSGPDYPRRTSSVSQTVVGGGEAAREGPPWKSVGQWKPPSEIPALGVYPVVKQLDIIWIERRTMSPNPCSVACGLLPKLYS
jgi:hypothetical protein